MNSLPIPVPPQRPPTEWNAKGTSHLPCSDPGFQVGVILAKHDLNREPFDPALSPTANTMAPSGQPSSSRTPLLLKWIRSALRQKRIRFPESNGPVRWSLSHSFFRVSETGLEEESCQETSKESSNLLSAKGPESGMNAPQVFMLSPSSRPCTHGRLSS